MAGRIGLDGEGRRHRHGGAGARVLGDVDELVELDDMGGVRGRVERAAEVDRVPVLIQARQRRGDLGAVAAVEQRDAGALIVQVRIRWEAVADPRPGLDAPSPP